MARTEGLMAPVQVARVPLTPEPRLRRLWRLLATFLGNSADRVWQRFESARDEAFAVTTAEQRRRRLGGLKPRYRYL